MSIPQDLLDQAVHLVTLERRRPKQVSLRRAVSAAYYALFHLLVGEAAASLVVDRDLRRLVGRAFDHAEMKQAAKAFASASLPKSIAAVAGTKVPKDLQAVAQAFVDLQDARHDADYNFAKSFDRTQVQAHIHQVRRAFEAWNRIKGRPIARIFLASLLLGNRWRRADT